MVCIEKGFDTLANLYTELIRQTLILHNVAEIKCENRKEHFFDRIVLKEDGELNIFNHGLPKPHKELFFDFTSDFATCLAYIEHDIYLAQRKGVPEKGMVITFKKERRASKRVV